MTTEVGCTHLDAINEDIDIPTEQVCQACVDIGDSWVHLRLCLTCGTIGCCDNSKNTHATKHYKAVAHPIIRSFESWETWMYCYVDDAMLE